jgi:hypothetical protein
MYLSGSIRLIHLELIRQNSFHWFKSTGNLKEVFNEIYYSISLYGFHAYNSVGIC